MRRCSGLALAAVVLASAASAEPARYIGTFVWQVDGPAFGGFSALDLSGDGAAYVALSDRGQLLAGRLVRDAAGVVTAAPILVQDWVRNAQGQRLLGKFADAEGVARDGFGGIWVSFEGEARVAHYPALGGPEIAVTSPRDFAAFPGNEGLEALAMDGAGTIYAIPERAMLRNRAFPVYRLRNGRWDRPFAIDAVGTWLPVSADFGPDGWLYVLYRDFLGIRGFLSRVVRYDLAGGQPGPGEILLETAAGEHDNLEGLAVWQDSQGLRLTLLSDDNFSVLQQTELVEYRLQN
jgi:hypothetical protein